MENSKENMTEFKATILLDRLKGLDKESEDLDNIITDLSQYINSIGK